MAVPAMKQLQLHLLPPPRNISESRAVLRTLQQFGEIDMFKVLRFEETTKHLTPKAHIIFRHATSAASLLAAGPIPVPSTPITVTPSESIFKHEQYIEWASASRYIKNEAVIAKRKLGAGYEVPEDDWSIRFGSEAHMVPTTQSREMRSRLTARYTAEFLGFKVLRERIQREEEQEERRRREENVKLAWGAEVDLEGRSEERLVEEQRSTIRDILSDLKPETEEIKKE